MKCPECSSRVEIDEGFPVWCAACEWGLGEAADRRGGSTSEAGWAREGFTRVGMYVLATVVHTFPLGLLAAAGALAVVGDGVVAYGLVAVLVGFAVTLRPRVGRLVRDVETLRRDEAPYLFGLFDEVAAGLGGKPVDDIVATAEFNASYAVLGWRRRRVVLLGLPLWRILTPGQKVALVGHELAHGVNGDCRRSLYVGSALGVLARLHRALSGDHLPDHEDGLMYVSRVVFTPVLWLCRGVVFLLYRGLERLTLSSGHRAEYYADELAARVASPEAVAELLETMTVLGPTVEFTIETSPTTRSPLPLWSRIDEAVTALPGGERDRRLRLAARESVQADDSHPPTYLRTARIRALPVREPRVTLTPEATARIDGELAAVSARIERDLTESAEAALYM